MGLLSLNRVIIPVFVGYIAYEVYGLYIFCQPPLADEASRGVKWDLLDAEPLDLCVYMALTDRPPPEGLISERRRPDGPVSARERSTYHLAGVFESVHPRTGVAPRRDIRLEELRLPRSFYRNGTIHLHVVAVPHSPEDATPVRHESTRISRYAVQPDRRVHKEYLLGAPPAGDLVPSDLDIVEAAVGDAPVTSLPRIVEVGFVTEERAMDERGLNEKGYEVYVQRDVVKLPLFVNTLVAPRDEYAPIFKGTKMPGLELRLRNVGIGFWTMQQQISMAFDEAERMYGMNEYDADSFKQMISGSTPLKAVLVYAVSVLHLVFEYLAFSSDISFWRKKTSFEGLSSASVTLQACMNIVMFLYVQEQRQTKLVMYFIAFRFCLQLWKLTKLTKIQLSCRFPFVRWVNRLGAETGMEELQDIHDTERRCMRVLVISFLPLVVAFCSYRLIHYKFRSWYSWIVLSLAICSQIGGFVVMTPQVFMNWRLKSVEHLPWKALTYQAINTFIDDIFMLCIRMPEVQKYSVFRDDIIFVICCIQRWMYMKPASVDVTDGEGKGALNGGLVTEADVGQANKAKEE